MIFNCCEVFVHLFLGIEWMVFTDSQFILERFNNMLPTGNLLIEQWWVIWAVFCYSNDFGDFLCQQHSSRGLESFFFSITLWVFYGVKLIFFCFFHFSVNKSTFINKFNDFFLHLCQSNRRKWFHSSEYFYFI